MAYPRNMATEIDASYLIDATAEAIALEVNASGLSYREVADRMGVAHTRISRILSGTNLTLRSIAEVADALGKRAEVTFYDLPDDE